RHDQWLRGRSKRDLSLPSRCRVSALRSRGLQRPDSICRSCATETRFDPAWFRGGIRAGFARTWYGSLGAERRKSAGIEIAKVVPTGRNVAATADLVGG